MESSKSDHMSEQQGHLTTQIVLLDAFRLIPLGISKKVYANKPATVQQLKHDRIRYMG